MSSETRLTSTRLRPRALPIGALALLLGAASACNLTSAASEPSAAPAAPQTPAPTPPPPAPPVAAEPPGSAAVDASVAPANPQPAVDLSALPQDVLVGTDVYPLKSFLKDDVPKLATGSYRSEQGGASATVKLSSSANGWTLARRFAEPGAPPQNKTYSGLTEQAAATHLQGEGVHVLSTKEGVLVLEQRSEVDGLPAALWVLYEGKKASRKEGKQ